MCAKLVLALLAAMSCLLMTPRVSTRSMGCGLAVLTSCFATVGAQEGTWGDPRFNAQDPERDRSVAKLLMKQAKEVWIDFAVSHLNMHREKDGQGGGKRLEGGRD
jgi:hypothetical protein